MCEDIRKPDFISEQNIENMCIKTSKCLIGRRKQCELSGPTEYFVQICGLDRFPQCLELNQLKDRVHDGPHSGILYLYALQSLPGTSSSSESNPLFPIWEGQLHR
jgi:hypothetical protein